MDLADHQRKLLGLLRSSYEPRPDDDPYIGGVAQSRDLDEARGNILLWRVYVLERTAPLTFGLLRQRGLLGGALELFIRRRNISPFRETQAPAFLEMLGKHTDDLVASVARFELALSRVRRGDPGSYIVRWNVDPHAVLYGLAKGLPLESDMERGPYETFISREIPCLFQIVSLRAPATPSGTA